MEEVGLKIVSNLKWQKREEGTVRPKGSKFPLQLRHLHSQRRKMLDWPFQLHVGCRNKKWGCYKI